MTNSDSEFNKAVSDLRDAFARFTVSISLGWNDVQGRYNRSKVGIFWASLSVLIFVSALGPIYSKLFSIEMKEYMLHFVLGLVVWNYISGIVLDCGREFVNSENYLVSFQLSYFTVLFRVIWRNLIVFAFQIIVFVLLSAIFLHTPNLTWFIAPIALLVITLNALWMGLLMSILATRFRDLSELMNNVLRLVFFATPIMWLPGTKIDLATIVALNPFYHLIELFRGPLFTGTINLHSWLVAFVMLSLGWLVAFPLFVKLRSRIAFWL